MPAGPRGGGTPVPCDPPKRLVSTGPYAYIGNPMQTAMALILGWAFIAWTMRLPVLRPFLQLITDAVGGGPRLIARRPSRVTEESSG